MVELLFFLIFLIFVNNTEICEKFLGVYNFSDCYIPPVRRNGVDVACPNFGTWTCAEFFCEGQEVDGVCSSGIDINIFLCCTQKNIHYVDLWFTPYENQGDIEEDWRIRTYNIFIFGKGSNITIGNQLYETDYNFIGKETFISIVLMGYNDSSCQTDIYFYINGTLTITQLGYPLYRYDTEHGMDFFEFLPKPNNQTITFLSAHSIIPTPEDIMWLYSLGSNRSADVEICYDFPCNGDGGVSSVYKTTTIILGIVLGITLFLLFIFFLWFIYKFVLSGMLNTTPKYKEMGEY